MPVSVLFFGATAAETGTRQIQLPIHGSPTAGELFKEILNTYPRLSEHKLLFSINQRYSGGDEIVKEGDELAVFTAVSGG